MAKQAIRFSVSNKEGRRSATWICFTPKGKSDLYLACRELKGAMKASFHETGRNYVHFDERFLEEHAPKNSPLSVDRSLLKWDEPKESDQKVIQLFRIVVPERAVTKPISDEEERVFWIPAPSGGFAVEVGIYLTRPPEKVSFLPSTETIKDTLIGTIDLLNRGKVLVTYRVIEFALLKLPEGGRPWFFGKSSMEGLKRPGVAAIIIAGPDDDGIFSFIECKVKATGAT
jgi:hypothetical protein